MADRARPSARARAGPAARPPARPGARPGLRPLLAGAALAAAVVLLAFARGPVAILAAATVAVLTGFVLAVPPLLRHDGIDWDWLPDRAREVPPEPGIATLRRLLDPNDRDTDAPEQLQALVRAIAADRADGRPVGPGRLATYLDGPPRRLDLAEAEAVVTELEALPPKEHH
ncbi:hypothetical protein GCM10023168_24580 [Fodinibacter luteus]|uniref:Uncharacterized protein n=1 Tax=Fodinibacter luteus TaxID=552064 RepID=A0ABP8KIE5_9MICO